MKKIILLLALVLQGCVSTVEQDTKVSEEKAFSISKSIGMNGSFILIGVMQGCSIRWEAVKGILTHRSSCAKASSPEALDLMTEMAFKFKKESPIRIEYVRFTSKDFQGEEERLAKMMTQSKIWNELSKNYKKNKTEFQNKFLRKVIEKKKIFSLVPVALKRVGYNFKFDQVEVTKMTKPFESRYQNQLVERFEAKKGFLVPENIRVVLKRNYQN